MRIIFKIKAIFRLRRRIKSLNNHLLNEYLLSDGTYPICNDVILINDEYIKCYKKTKYFKNGNCRFYIEKYGIKSTMYSTWK